MITVGCRAIHKNSRESYGRCKVLEVNPSGTALVHWEKPRVKRRAMRPGRTPLTERESHVDTRSLTRID
jgi:hypothetical protein